MLIFAPTCRGGGVWINTRRIVSTVVSQEQKKINSMQENFAKHFGLLWRDLSDNFCFVIIGSNDQDAFKRPRNNVGGELLLFLK